MKSVQFSFDCSREFSERKGILALLRGCSIKVVTSDVVASLLGD
jgi:hypothetical protein